MCNFSCLPFHLSSIGVLCTKLHFLAVSKCDFKDVDKYTLTVATRWLFHCSFGKGFYVLGVTFSIVLLETHTCTRMDPRKGSSKMSC